MTRPSRASTIFLGILTTILVGWVLHIGAGILQPLVIALFLASMLQPVVIGLKRYGIPPFVTVTLLIWALFLGLVQVGIVFEANISAFVNADVTDVEGTELTEGDPVPAEGTEETTLDPVSKANAEVTEALGGWAGVKRKIEVRLGQSSMPEPAKEYLSDSLDGIDVQGLAAGLIGSGFDLTKNVLLVLIYMVFIFAEQKVFRRKILAIAGDRREDAAEVLDRIGKGIQRYLGVHTLISAMTGGICYGVLVILDIPFAWLFGVLTFLLNYIPTFGSIIAGCFPTITALAAKDSVVTAVIVAVTYLTVNLTLGSFLEPRILGRRLNLSPLVIIVSVVVWAGLWGVVGTFLAVPLTATLQIVLASHESTRPIALMISGAPPKEARPPKEKSLEPLPGPRPSAAEGSRTRAKGAQ